MSDRPEYAPTDESKLGLVNDSLIYTDHAVTYSVRRLSLPLGIVYRAKYLWGWEITKWKKNVGHPIAGEFGFKTRRDAIDALIAHVDGQS